MATTNPLGRHPPHLVGNTELSFWGTSIDNSVGVLDFFFFFVSICLSMCQSVGLCICTLVSGLGQNNLCRNNQHLLVLLDLCVVWWFCEIFVFCLSSHLLLFLPGCEQLHYSTTAVLQIASRSALVFKSSSLR